MCWKAVHKNNEILTVSQMLIVCVCVCVCVCESLVAIQESARRTEGNEKVKAVLVQELNYSAFQNGRLRTLHWE